MPVKNHPLRMLWLALLSVIVVLAGATAADWSTPEVATGMAQIQLSQRFVRCSSVDATNPPQYTHFVLTCTTEDGIPFDEEGLTVPATWRLYITDFINESAQSSSYIVQQRGATQVALLQYTTASDYHSTLHLNSPYFVLLGGDRLYTRYRLYATGYVVSNQAFLPSVTR